MTATGMSGTCGEPQAEIDMYGVSRASPTPRGFPVLLSFSGHSARQPTCDSAPSLGKATCSIRRSALNKVPQN